MTSRVGRRLRLVHTAGRGIGPARERTLIFRLARRGLTATLNAPRPRDKATTVSTKNTSTEPAGAARARAARHSTTSATGLDLEAAFSRIASLDDEQLQALVDDLDSALAECRGCLVGDADMDLVSVAAGARIALRRRKAAAARSRAFHRVRHLTSTETIE